MNILQESNNFTPSFVYIQFGARDVLVAKELLMVSNIIPSTDNQYVVERRGTDVTYEDALLQLLPLVHGTPCKFCRGLGFSPNPPWHDQCGSFFP